MTRKLAAVIYLSLIGFAFSKRQESVVTAEDAWLIDGREVIQKLYIDNPYHDSGEWGPEEVCEEGSFAEGIEILYESPGNLDETAINAVKLYCTSTEGHDTGYVTSTAGRKGDWYGMQICSTDFVTGFRANVLEYQGIFGDDVAVEDFEVDCNDGREIIDALPIPVPMKKGGPTPYDFKAGEWSSYATCREGLAVCGLQTRFEDGSLGDEAAVVDVIFFCCERQTPAV